MSPSLVKILDGKFHKSEPKITLTVELLKGLPKVTDCFFFTDMGSSHWDGYVIEKVIKTASPRQYELVLPFAEQYPIWESIWKEYPEEQKQTAVCGLNEEHFARLTTRKKAHYFSVLADVAGAGRIPEFLKSTIEPALKFAPAKRKDGVSLMKFGGLPIAPEGFNFPKDNHGKSLLFIGQIHIGELKQRFKTSEQFKGKGILYFFGTIRIYDGKYHSFENIVVLHSEHSHNLKTTDLPADLNEYGIFEETSVDITEEITIPDMDTSLWQGERMTDEEYDSFQNIDSFLEYYNWSRTIEYSQLLGHPESIRRCVLLETQIKHAGLPWPTTEEWEKVVTSLTPHAKQWKMVLMLDVSNKYFRGLSKFNGEFNQYMDGNFYVMIKKTDFDAMNFNNTVSIYQST
jgi:uncharacterized protein YwqG